jgi:HSP20 family protein
MRRRGKMTPNIARAENDKVGRNYPISPFRMFEDFFNDWAVRSVENRRSKGWVPAVDVLEREGNLILMISLPGIHEKEIDLKVEGQVLTIIGERTSLEADGYSYHQTESRFGTFSRSFTLPETTDLENIKADYKNGVLNITVPQKPEIKPRTIKVNT